MKKTIGDLDFVISEDSVSITKNYNDAVSDTVRLNQADILDLEYAIKTIQRYWEFSWQMK